MRDRAAERARCGSFRVDMNPLMIVCGFGERVDALLGDVVPLRRAKFLADELLELGEGGRADGQLVFSHRYPFTRSSGGRNGPFG